MAANMKSLVFLLGAAPLVTAALLWRARTSPRTAALAGLLWLAPMVTVWTIYSSTPRWTTEAYTLEYNVYRTQVVVARAHGRTAPLPTDLGWHPTDEKQRGYWGVGRPGAWSNLDKVLQFLTRGPQHNLDPSVRFEGAISGLTRALHLPNAALLLLGIVGCIVPLRRRRGLTTWVRARDRLAGRHHGSRVHGPDGHALHSPLRPRPPHPSAAADHECRGHRRASLRLVLPPAAVAITVMAQASRA